jgi:spoIIIJ-associated protein
MDASLVERGQQWLEQLLHLLGFPSTVTTEVNHPLSEGGCWLIIDETQLTPEQIQSFIEPDAALLDSIQYLANATLNLGQDAKSQGAFTVDLAGYRLRRYQELKAIAEQAAERVRQTGQQFELKSLSSAERRQVHTILKDYADLATHSHGQEPDRRLIVSLLQQPPS